MLIYAICKTVLPLNRHQDIICNNVGNMASYLVRGEKISLFLLTSLILVSDFLNYFINFSQTGVVCTILSTVVYSSANKTNVQARNIAKHQKQIHLHFILLICKFYISTYFYISCSKVYSGVPSNSFHQMLCGLLEKMLAFIV